MLLSSGRLNSALNQRAVKVAVATPPPQPAMWSDKNNADVLLSLDGSDVSSMTLSGTEIRQWRDRSLTGLVFNPVATGPQFTGGRLVATNTGQEFARVPNTIVAAIPHCTLVVLANATVGASRNIFEVIGNTPNLQYKLSNTESGYRFGNGNKIFPQSPDIRIDAFIKFGTTYGEARMRRNGIELTATGSGGTGSTFNQSNPNIGLYENLWAGEIFGYILLKGSDADLIEKAKGYLAHRHNRTDLLAATHPYKTSAPPA